MTDSPSQPLSPARPPAWWCDWLPLLAILLVGAGLRAWYMDELVQSPDFAHLLTDPLFHDYWARALVSGDWTPPDNVDDPHLTSIPYLRPPGYTYFLAAVYWLLGPSYVAVRVVQMAVGLVNCLLAYALGRSLFGRAVGLVTAGLMATYWVFIYYEGELQEPFLLVTLALAAVLVLRHWTLRPAWWWAGLGGVLCGLFALVRPNILMFVPVAVVWAAWVLWRQRLLRRWLASAAAIVAGSAVVIAPVTIRNYVAGHELVLVATNGAITFYIGNNPLSDGARELFPDVEKITGTSSWSWLTYDQVVQGVSKEVGRPLTHSEVSAYFTRRALEFMRENPGREALLTLRRALLFWGPVEVSNNKVIHYDHVNSAALRWLPNFPLALALAWLGLVLLAVQARARRRLAPAAEDGTGVVSASPRQLESIVLILLWVATYFASFVLILVAGRFRVPVIPFLLLFGACGLCQLGDWVRRQEYNRAAIWAVIGLVLFGLANIQIAYYCPDQPAWHVARGTAYSRAGDNERAIEEYRKAVEVAGDKPYPEALRRLIVQLEKAGRRNETVPYYEALLRITPAGPEMLRNAGMALSSAGRLPEAEVVYRQAIDLEPTNADAHAALGGVLARLGNPAEAQRELREALRLQPDNALASYNLGETLFAQNAIDEALAAYRAAVAANPAMADAHVGLGAALSEKGQIDAAVAEYEEAIKLEPQHFAAHYNMGLAWAAKGDLARAIASMETAAQIQPNNALAREELAALRAELAQRRRP